MVSMRFFLTIQRKYPQVKRLFEIEHNTKWLVLAVTIVQLSIASCVFNDADSWYFLLTHINAGSRHGFGLSLISLEALQINRSFSRSTRFFLLQFN
jgi:hypothetical protein